MKLRHHKKGALENLGTLITALGGLAILIAVIFLIIGELRTTTEAYSVVNASAGDYGIANASRTAVMETQDATSDIPGWLPIVVITIIGGVLLSLVRFYRSR